MPSILYIRRAEKFVLFIKRHEEETKLEIERKFLVKRENLPENLEQYPSKAIEQGYLCTEPVVRIRKSNDNYFLTYKSKGLLAREEYLSLIHISEPTRLGMISYAVFCLKKKK